MENLSERIYDYCKYLRNQHSVRISFHFNSLIPNPVYNLKNYYALVRHTSSYCLKIKTSKKNCHRCLLCQKMIFEKIKQTPVFIGSCHADVCEYIHGIKHKGEYVGFISVGGYIPEKQRLEKDFELSFFYNSSMQENMPSISFFNSIITPLRIMLELYIDELCSKPQVVNSDYVKVLNYINDNYKYITRDDICKQFNYSKSYISHLFKKNNGQSISQYSNSLKIEDAKTLLKTTALPVSQVAILSGFNHISYFIKTFNSITGTSPLQYRARFKK